jgi:hypothetical protein
MGLRNLEGVTEPIFRDDASGLDFFAMICQSGAMRRSPPLMALLVMMTVLPALAADRVTPFDEGRLEISLPDGWKVTEQTLAGSDSVAGWESSDRKTSFYVLQLRLQNQGDDMRRALRSTIDAMDQDENWVVQKIGDFRDITLNGLPAAYVKVDLELRSGGRQTPFVFHFAMVGAENSFFLLQSSTMKPIWQPREDEIIRMIKSFKVLKEE